jgi:hypothetical protein
MNMHAPRMFIKIEVRDSNGKIIEEFEREGHSWVGNLILILCSMAFGGNANSTGYVASCGGYSAPRNTDGEQVTWKVRGDYNNAYVGMCYPYNGILVGSNNTPTSLGDFNLKSVIGSTILSRGNVTATPVTYDTTYYFTISRTFTNVSGNSVSVGEVGLFYGTGSEDFMLARDVFNPTITIPVNGTLTCTYRIELSLS